MKSAQTAVGEQGREAIGFMAQEMCQSIDAGSFHFKVGDVRACNALGVEAVHGLSENARGANSAALWGVEAWKGGGDSSLDVAESR